MSRKELGPSKLSSTMSGIHTKAQEDVLACSQKQSRISALEREAGVPTDFGCAGQDRDGMAVHAGEAHAVLCGANGFSSLAWHSGSRLFGGHLRGHARGDRPATRHPEATT